MATPYTYQGSPSLSNSHHTYVTVNGKDNSMRNVYHEDKTYHHNPRNSHLYYPSVTEGNNSYDQSQQHSIPSRCSQKTYFPHFSHNVGNTNGLSQRGVIQLSTTDSHESDEEAAATALLLAAGGPRRDEVENMERIKKENVESFRQNDGPQVLQSSISAQSGNVPSHVSPNNFNSNHNMTKQIETCESTSNTNTKCSRLGIIQQNCPCKYSDSQSDEQYKSECSRKGYNSNFPSLLHDALSKSKYSGSILEWLPHGMAWRVLRWNALLDCVIPDIFPELCICDSKHKNNAQKGVSPGSERMNNFLYYVKSWGFEEVKQMGVDIGSYRHELFIRGARHLCNQIYFAPRNDKKVIQCSNCADVSRENTLQDDENPIRDNYIVSSHSQAFNGKIASSPGRFSMTKISAINIGVGTISPSLPSGGARRVVTESPESGKKRNASSSDIEACPNLEYKTPPPFVEIQGGRLATNQQLNKVVVSPRSSPPRPILYRYHPSSCQAKIPLPRLYSSDLPSTPMRTHHPRHLQMTRSRVPDSPYLRNLPNMISSYQTPPDRVVARSNVPPPFPLRSGRGGVRVKVTPTKRPDCCDEMNNRPSSSPRNTFPVSNRGKGNYGPRRASHIQQLLSEQIYNPNRSLNDLRMLKEPIKGSIASTFCGSSLSSHPVVIAMSKKMKRVHIMKGANTVGTKFFI